MKNGSFRKSAGLAFGILGVLAVLSFVSAGRDVPLLLAKLSWSTVVAFLGFRIYRDGVISRYRAILFILTAFLFFLEFKFFRFISFGNTPSAPYCHIAEASTLSNFVHSQVLAIKSGDWRVWGVLTMGFLWLLIIFTIGQGICSWVCFFGGIDEGFSKIAKRPILKFKAPGRWRDLPIAFLIFILVVTFLQGLPVFCSWFCPFKMTEAFWAADPVTRKAQAVLFWSILAGAVIIIPILTGKRIFCSFICPFGALVSISGKASPYAVTIDKEKCSRCGKCMEVCPSLAVETTASGEYKTTNFCTRCSKCIDICPSDAISIFSGPSGARIDTRDIFIFLSLLVAGALSGSFVPNVFLRLAGLR
ncbi:MAG: 4Fe-4S binding protein [Candidatus Omnitrophica bacterium]|nr:4Fe-4S binding protein [Candidatus Omnitrophota bacterium]